MLMEILLHCTDKISTIISVCIIVLTISCDMVQFSPLANLSIPMLGFNIFNEFPKVPKTLKFTDISVRWKKGIQNYGNISKNELDERPERQEDAFNKSRDRRND
jgi:hypothetical protein